MKTIRYLEIAGTSGRTGYSKFVDKVATGLIHRDLIEHAAKADKLPDADDELSDAGALSAPTRNLDIHFGKTKGMVVVALRLPKDLTPSGAGKPSKKSALEFLSSPVLPLPSNFKHSEKYIDDAEIASSGANRCAWFKCDLDWIRKQSKLAAAIKQLRHDHAHSIVHDSAIMRIPFMLNVIDRELGFAPWMIPSESPAPVTDGSPLSAPGAIMTHGGVHPQFASYLTLDLDA